MKQNKLKLSIVIPTLNNQKQIDKFLKTLKNQDFPKNKLEIIISDGGSTDKTITIAKRMGAKIIKNPFVFADPGVNLGIQKAKGELIMVLACDNLYYDKDALKKMVSVFDNKSIFAAFPMHCSSKNDSIFTKYVNTFTDPFSHFVYGYGANGRTFKNIYRTISSNESFDVYDYLSNPDRPMIAVAQGFTMRSSFTRSRESMFDDILPVIELIEKKRKIAYVHGVKLYHHTIRDVGHFVRKQTWATINALQRKNYGISQRVIYLSYSQQLRMKLWPIYALSFVFPSFYALKGLIHDREPLWIFHPFLCMISALASVKAVFIYVINKNQTFKR